MEGEVISQLKEMVAAGKSRRIILEYLKTGHGVEISTRSLNRYMAENGIRRMDSNVSVAEVTGAIANERSGSGANYGYRMMQTSLRRRHGLLVSRSKVITAMQLVDPERYFMKARWFPWERRLVYCPGPNFRWCEDGYDKLGKYKIFIHGCLDEYSRRVMWLKAHRTNRKADIVASYYLETVEKHGVVPKYVNSDHGQESTLIAVCQTFFFRDDDSPASHHRWTYSVNNVTIESWWRRLRQMAAQYWLNEFQWLEEMALWGGDVFDEWAMLTVYLPLIQEDLYRVASDHNNHVIREQRDRIRPGGRPDDLYNLPHLYGGRRCGREVSLEEIEVAKRKVGYEHVEDVAVPVEVNSIVKRWFRDNGVSVSRENASDVYTQVRAMLKEGCNM